MSKPQKSKLDQFAETLADLEHEKKTLAEMQAWLRGEGCSVSLSRLGSFLESQRSSRQQAQMLAQISSGARQHEEMVKQFGKNPAPELETIIKLHRVLSMQLATQSVDNPELIKLADQLTRTVMEFSSAKTKHDLEQQKISLGERRVALLEKKAAAFDQVKAAVNSGGITPETLSKIERELKLL